jgi:hypothetical protein
MEQFKDKVTKVQDRLRIVSFAIQAIPTGIAMSREITKSPTIRLHYQ